MSFEDLTVEHLDEMNKVVERYLQGSDPTQISKELALPRQRVVTHLNQWKSMAADNAAIRARAKEALVAADTHYNQASTTANLPAKNSAIKLVLDIESKRIDMLQKAGLLENKELAEEMIEIERKQDILKGILQDIAAEHPEVRDKIMRRLSDIAKNQETITIVNVQ
jgi:hypothetical protein